MAERTRVFTGTLPESGQRVLVQVFEEEGEIIGMEAALRYEAFGGRFSGWGPPAEMAEEET